jgi:3',5'-cyclic AMP phosphodiesterase CpdA
MGIWCTFPMKVEHRATDRVGGGVFGKPMHSPSSWPHDRILHAWWVQPGRLLAGEYPHSSLRTSHSRHGCHRPGRVRPGRRVHPRRNGCRENRLRALLGRQGPHLHRERQEERMDSHISFLSTAHADLLNEILARRSPTILERIRRTGSVSRSHAEEIMSVISDEVTENLDDDWEPTDYGQAVSAVLAQFNAARVSEWPQAFW